jgi:hypothetical protein
MALPAIVLVALQAVGVELVKKGGKELAEELVLKALTRKLKPASPNSPPPLHKAQSTSQKDTRMNPVFIGALRHILQLAAGAIGATAYASGTGLELLVAVGVSVASLAWFAITNWTASRKG